MVQREETSAPIMQKLQYPLARPKIGRLERELLLQAFDSGWISSSGEFIEKFQAGFAGYVGTKFGVSTSNGTTAIHLALAALGVGPGDEVIVPDLTFISPANMVSQAGAKPVFADSNKEYWGVDANTLKRRLSRKTKAIIVVHLYGHPVDVGPIVELCEARNLALIEDCAEAHGALYKGRKVGSFGRVSCFSFYGNKIVTTGEGGICLTDDSDLRAKMQLLRDHGADRRQHFWHPIAGFNYRMTNLQAAIGCAQLQNLDERVEKYREIGHYYSSSLKERLGDMITVHPEMKWARCVFWMYTFLLHDKRKNALINYLESNGVESRPMFYPVSSLPPYRKKKSNQKENRIAQSLSEMGLSLPTYLDLRHSDIDAITTVIEDFVKGRVSDYRNSDRLSVYPKKV